MEQLRTVWNALEPRRRWLAAGATLGVFVAVLLIARMATSPSMALLYGGLEGARSGEVIQVLDQRGIPYEVRGDAIYVDASARDETRMALAAQGLPANSATGYELLDGLTGFGTTSQMFDAAYWRAKEGELARTITASPHIRDARVHISHGATQPFRQAREASASVTVTPAGAGVTPDQARALRFLVASAVTGLRPDAVAVIDGASGQVIAEDRGPNARASERAELLRRNVERLLEAHVGPGRAVVEVNVDTVTDRETIREHRIDPDSRVAINQESEERNATASDTRTNSVTVASNLPDGDGAGGDGSQQSREEETRERIAYEVSQTSREIERGPGAIRRLSVAVLVDGTRGRDDDGAMQWTPRPEAELAMLRELVAAAVGYDEARGDVITLQSLPFEPVSGMDGAGADSGLVAQLGLDVMALLRLVALAAVVVFLAVFVLRPLLINARGPREGAGPGGLARMGTAGGLPAPAEDAGGDWSDMAALNPLPAPMGTPLGGPMPGAYPDFDADAAGGGPPEDPVERMRALIADRQDETIEILRNWMEEPEESR
ncbi:MAG: flagellar M-ring protein FliF [Rhodobacteraceae bacterium HLUCCA12]|nr:MAG: flagellar M-ring protein FliF [Rhodobacteraceae bacterium HLUCCA12]